MSKSSVQLCENNWIQVLSFYTRPQLFRLVLVHRIFHSLVEQYFPVRPYAPTLFAIYLDAHGHLCASIAIIEWNSPRLTSPEWKMVTATTICKTTRWIGVNGYSQLNENARAMEKCERIVEIGQDERHVNCPDWHLYAEPFEDGVDERGAGHNLDNVEFAIFEHKAHLERDTDIFTEINQNARHKYPYIMPPQVCFPIRLNAKIRLDGSVQSGCRLLAHLDLPFIRVQNAEILQMSQPWWIEEEENSKKGDCGSATAATEDINFANQLYGTLAIVFTAQHYRNVPFAALFSCTEMTINICLLSKILLLLETPNTMHHQHQHDATIYLPSTSAAEFFRSIAISCHRLILYLDWKIERLNTSPLKELICNTNGLSLIFPFGKTPPTITGDIVPMLYSYNPKENVKCVLKIGTSQEYQICKELLAIILKDSLQTKNADDDSNDQNSRSKATYHLKMEIFDEFDIGWQSVCYKINKFLGQWEEWRQKNEEAEEIYSRTNVDFVFTNSQHEQQRKLQKNVGQFYFTRIIFSPTENGCYLRILQYKKSELAFHEKMRARAQHIAKWWRRCYQLAYAFDGAATPLHNFWQEDVQNEFDFVRVVDEGKKMSESWTNYIMAKWLQNWLDFDNY